MYRLVLALILIVSSRVLADPGDSGVLLKGANSTSNLSGVPGMMQFIGALASKSQERKYIPAKDTDPTAVKELRAIAIKEYGRQNQYNALAFEEAMLKAFKKASAEEKDLFTSTRINEFYKSWGHSAEKIEVFKNNPIALLNLVTLDDKEKKAASQTALREHLAKEAESINDSTPNYVQTRRRSN